MDIERLKELKADFEKACKYNDMYYMSTVAENDMLELIDEAIARQSVTSEEVQEAIEYLQPLTEHPIMSGNFAKHIKTAVTALQAYQPWIQVSEGKRTTQWYQYMCELIEAIESAYHGKEQQEN